MGCGSTEGMSWGAQHGVPMGFLQGTQSTACSLVLQHAHRHKHTLTHTYQETLSTFLKTVSTRKSQVFLWLGDYNFGPASLLFMLSKWKVLWRLIGLCIFIYFARAQPCWFLNYSNLKRASISLTWKTWVLMKPTHYPLCSVICNTSSSLCQYTSPPDSSEKSKLDFSVTMKIYEGVRHLAQQIWKFSTLELPEMVFWSFLGHFLP